MITSLTKQTTKPFMSCLWASLTLLNIPHTNTHPRHRLFLLTLTTCSFGRRLQSARVSSFPSRYLRVDPFSSSMLSASISSGSGEFIKISSFLRALRRPLSRSAVREDKIWIQLHQKCVFHIHIQCEQMSHFKQLKKCATYLHWPLLLCFLHRLKIWQRCHFLLRLTPCSLQPAWDTWNSASTSSLWLKWAFKLLQVKSIVICPLYSTHTWEEPAFPPETLQSCWHRSSLPHWR